MPRARLLKIGFFKNEDLAALPPEGRLLFAGLLLIADREGLLLDKPRRLGAEIFPYEQVDADDLLNQLARAGFIVRYEVDGERFIAIPKFLEHQKPHPREAPSVLPKPRLTQGEPQASPGQAQATPRRPVSVSITDPVSMGDPVSLSVSDPVPKTGAVSRSARAAKNGYDDALAKIVRSVLKEIGPHQSLETITDHVAYFARQKHLTFNPNDIAQAIAVVMPESRRASA
jgi:hypothetical protein